MLSILLSCTLKYIRARTRHSTWPRTAGQPCRRCLPAFLSLRLPAGTKPGLFPAPAAAVEGHGRPAAPQSRDHGHPGSPQELSPVPSGASSTPSVIQLALLQDFAREEPFLSPGEAVICF